MFCVVINQMQAGFRVSSEIQQYSTLQVLRCGVYQTLIEDDISNFVAHLA